MAVHHFLKNQASAYVWLFHTAICHSETAMTKKIFIAVFYAKSPSYGKTLRSADNIIIMHI